MAVVDLPFRPGVVKDETAYGARGYAVDSDLIRWVRGKPQVQGGWTAKVSGIQGKARACHEWKDNAGVGLLAIGTHTKLYVHSNSRLIDITPARADSALGNNPVATTNGSTIVTITHTAHGAEVGDTVYISGLSVVAGMQVGGGSYLYASTNIQTRAGMSLVGMADPTGGMDENDIVELTTPNDVGGITVADFARRHRVQVRNSFFFQIDTGVVATATATGVGSGDSTLYRWKPYTILSKTANTYTIDAGLPAANATTTGGGAGGWAEYDLNIGVADGAAPIAATPGQPDPETGAPIYPRQWNMDNWGDQLVANLSYGPIYSWPGTTPCRATQVPNSPAQAFRVAVTPERVLLACGCTNTAGDFDPLLVRNSDIEDITVWTPSATNSAGDFRLGIGSWISGVAKRGKGVFLFTDRSLHAVRYVGSFDQIYTQDQLGTDCGMVGDHTIAQRSDVLYWITPSFEFYRYDGGKPATLENPNREWFRSRLTQYQENKIFAFSDPLYEAVGWLFPADGELECSEYLRLDIPEHLRDAQAGWSVGMLDRLVWSHGSYFIARKPLAVGSDGVLYQHEDGWNDDGDPRAPFIEYAPFDVRDGSVRATVSEVIVDMSLSADATVTLKAREYPKGTERTKALTITPTTARATTRISGAQIGFRVDFDGETYTRLSSVRGDVSEDGSR